MSEEKKKRLQKYQKNYRKAKKHFTNADMPIKVHYKIAIAKIFFVCSFINFLKENVLIIIIKALYMAKMGPYI